MDYLRLLYWVFFFPQALRWYVDTFGGGYIPEKEMNWRKGLELLHENAIQRQLLLQGLVLTVVTPLALGVILQEIDVPLVWFGVAIGVVGGMVGSTINRAGDMAGSVAGSVVGSVVGGVAGSVVGGILSREAAKVVGGVLSHKVGVVTAGMGGVIATLVAFWVAGSVSGRVDGNLLLYELYSALILASIVGLGAMGDGLMGGTAWLLPVVLLAAILRPENWLLGLPRALQLPTDRYWSLPHVTLLPIPSLYSQLTSWLRRDWERGLDNANLLLSYTLQFIPVFSAVHQVLTETPPDQIIFRIAQLTEALYGWYLVGYIFTLEIKLLLGARGEARVDSLEADDITWSRQIQALLDTEFNSYTQVCLAAAGFCFLHKKKPEIALMAFAPMRSLLYGEEMFALAQTLATFYEAKEATTIATLQISAFPPKPLLRPTTWQAITSLRGVVEDVRLVQRSLSKSTRSFAVNRALGELKTILNNTDSLPSAERELLVTIAKTWQEALLNVASEVGEISITQPVTNPYVVGDPVEGNLFVGREDVLRQLEELWVMGHQLQSVVLYGHRRMGKTSILRNAANCSGSGVKVAYINLLNMGATSQGVGEVLMAISDEISDAVGCTPPSDNDLLNLPYRTFERYLKQVEAHLSGGLIVALDEFEKIEELIEAQKIPKDFMGYLRGLVQMSSKVAFAFAGLHTLEEMTADYFQPFFASVIPIHVGFLQPGATRQILANPTNNDPSLSSPRGGGIEGGDFPLDYTPEALDQIYALTAGQPYLVQLVGFQLVRRYNDFVFEQGRTRAPVFTVEDVKAVINDPEFFKRGRYYFDGVWGQAARGASGQQAILRALAPHPQGLSLDELRTHLDEFVGATHVSPLQEETLQEALKTLTRHDVIQEREGRWQIIVELFRRWVLQN
jgi:hypothetical protein